jgi:uncharacterized membrane protein
VLCQIRSRLVHIKAWSVSLAAAIASLGAFTEHYILLVYASFAALLFWLIDSYWKTFQFAYYKRIGQIEDFLSNKSTSISTPQIGTTWGESYNEGGWKRFFQIMLWPHVLLPHGVMSIGFLCAYLFINT